ncbi:PREDICTED: rho GTPase-activating protein gacF [Nicrophorus vespilloides]|uniref:Rho GTPase-activating protein gacF n=1 Tax=Nicrophorus vespilloides TaxID=110193 RepID=A0ABM1MWE5_NICVS|nr:PREDICTED: rho GTPase-activating protein gacF [Nicrophorus vespilloides]
MMETKTWSEKLQQTVQTTVTNMDNGNNLLDNTNTQPDNKNNNEDTCNRNLRLQQDVLSAISDKGRQKVQSIVEQVFKLKPIEKLLLYLKLPTESTDNVDPLRQSINPLGSRSEIHATITWIETHLVEDPDLSLQKKGVYDDYQTYCTRNGIKPLSTADFGKVMKQVYPNVRPRRLGTRGQSKYCYAGLRSRTHLPPPLLPDLGDKPLSSESHCSQSDLITAAWIIIKEWADDNFKGKFKSLTSLAYHLVKEYSIGSGSEAANLVLNANNKDESTSYGYSRHRETTLQLQRKLQQKNEGAKDSKRKQLQSPRSDQKSRPKKMKSMSASTSSSTSPVAASDSKSSPHSQEHSPVCDSNNLQTLPDFNCFQRPPNTVEVLRKDAIGAQEMLGEFQMGKVPIPRIANPKQSPVLSPKRAKNNNTQYKAIQPKPECDRVSYNPTQTLIAKDLRSQQQHQQQHHHQQQQDTIKRQRLKKKDSPIVITTEESNSLFSRERLDSVSQVPKDAFDAILETSNSQGPEEEIVQYFNNNNDDNEKKISELRQLLVTNSERQNNGQIDNKNMSSMSIGSNLLAKPNMKPMHKTVLPSLNVKRRVSFDNHIQEETVPASPNTHRQNINFIPISPHSPNGRQSSTNASPFVSPRNTPVPRLRGNSSNPYANSTTKKPKKLISKKPDLEVCITDVEDKTANFKSQFINLAMSAPPSPKIPYHQFKRNQNFVPQISNTMNFGDSLSPEVSQLTKSIPLNEDTSYRSQSVPIQNQYHQYSPFNFAQNEQSQLSNDFNDIELNDNVNKIIENIEYYPNDFEDNISCDFANQASAVAVVSSATSGPPRSMVRSQSIDVESNIDSSLKFPSRSVPSTPVPHSNHYDQDFFGKQFGQGSKLSSTQNTLTFNRGQDYLLNGQPIKSPHSETKNLTYVYQDNELIDNKNFTFESHLPEGTFGAKQNINMLNEDFFDVPQ